MNEDPRVTRLLDELLDSRSSPEHVCADCPELLPIVRKRWRQIRRIGADLNALFPVTPADPPAEPEFPQIPGYAVEGLLGRGGMGIVFRARHLRLDRPVALKMILAGPYAVPEERERFVREASAVAALRHPNVVEVYDAGECDGRPYYTMELVDGGRLSENIAGTPQPARDAAALLATVADAVAAAHHKGIVHRDLSPANVLLEADGTPKVTDFGLARRVDADAGLTLSGVAVGTPSYMAPEQARGDTKAIGPAADVYALGAILYELLTGRPPFRAQTAAATIQHLLADEPVPPARLNPCVPRDLQTICLKCLQKEPARRYAGAAELADDLRRFGRGEPIAARPVGRLERAVRWLRRHPSAAAAFAATAVLALTFVVTAAWWYRQRSAAELDAKVELRQAEQYRQEADFGNATAALERARRRLGGIGAPALRAALDREWATVELLRQLDEIRIDRAVVVGQIGIENALVGPPDDLAKPSVPPLWAVPPDARYEDAFRTAGIGAPGDDPARVAGRVKASPAPESLIAALDDWAACAIHPDHQRWIRSVLKIADSDPWRNRVRDPANWHDPAALEKLADDAPVSDQPPQILVLLAARLRAVDRDARPLMTRVALAHPTDFWANIEMATALLVKNSREAIGYYRAASIIRPRLAITHDQVSVAYARDRRWQEAIAYSEQAIRLNPRDPSYHNNYGYVLLQAGRVDDAIASARESIRLGPAYDLAHDLLSFCYARQGRHEEALAESRLFLRLTRPEWVPLARATLLTRLLEIGSDPEARDLWREALAGNPPDHGAWFGYAELCLFLGDEVAYRRARADLLKRFGDSRDPVICERSAKACLLLDGEPAELKAAAALADRAVAKLSASEVGYPHALFAQGLAAYRLGRFDDAIRIMNGKAAAVAGPCPKLVVTMALFRTGETGKVRELLDKTIATSDWSRKIGRGDREPFWVAQVLRREAESLIRPQLPN